LCQETSCITHPFQYTARHTALPRELLHHTPIPYTASHTALPRDLLHHTPIPVYCTTHSSAKGPSAPHTNSSILHHTQLCQGTSCTTPIPVHCTTHSSAKR
ncbi:hypothetical protein NDU88_000795, partial [Pleurodeles waltl]